ncbi:MAG TPA: IS21 family transposase [Thiolapillus brandeum]|uniref:IS21 family transposase n=1 Tax=Thiolapillus brandeum TaxID=1076588 RepID=A0A7C5IXZ1_9GAMM|nr:IS21 family transposase [Thiolapillus brandeum]
MARLSREERMTIKTLTEKQLSNREVARLLAVSEGTVRYHRRRMATGAVDGRSRQQPLAAAWQEAIKAYLQDRDEPSPSNVAELHAHLVAEHDYPGSLRSLQRYVRKHWPPPPRRARRRVETPPGAQAQADWAHFPGVWVAGVRQDLYAFEMQLSWSRHCALVWSDRKHQLAWLSVHNEAFRRLQGIPACVRVDNEKTAVSRGAGAWGTLNPAYRSYARAVRFHIDLCPPRTPQAKGKVERRIRDHRSGLDPYRRHWESLAELQAVTDERLAGLARRRRCPATGTDVETAWHREREYLAPVLPVLPEPFDTVATRRVGEDGLVAFEHRQYSVPFRLLGERVEVRGCSRTVQIFHDGALVASHPRHTHARLLLDPAHYQGPSTDRVIAPPPLGKMGQRLQELAAMAPEQRPLDLYAALVEVAR